MRELREPSGPSRGRKAGLSPTLLRPYVKTERTAVCGTSSQLAGAGPTCVYAPGEEVFRTRRRLSWKAPRQTDRLSCSFSSWRRSFRAGSCGRETGPAFNFGRHLIDDGHHGVIRQQTTLRAVVVNDVTQAGVQPWEESSGRKTQLSHTDFGFSRPESALRPGLKLWPVACGPGPEALPAEPVPQ